MRAVDAAFDRRVATVETGDTRVFVHAPEWPAAGGVIEVDNRYRLARLEIRIGALRPDGRRDLGRSAPVDGGYCRLSPTRRLGRLRRLGHCLRPAGFREHRRFFRALVVRLAKAWFLAREEVAVPVSNAHDHLFRAAEFIANEGRGIPIVPHLRCLGYFFFGPAFAHASTNLSAFRHCAALAPVSATSDRR